MSNLIKSPSKAFSTSAYFLALALLLWFFLRLSLSASIAHLLLDAVCFTHWSPYHINPSCFKLLLPPMSDACSFSSNCAVIQYALYLLFHSRHDVLGKRNCYMHFFFKKKNLKRTAINRPLAMWCCGREGWCSIVLQLGLSPSVLLVCGLPKSLFFSP